MDYDRYYSQKAEEMRALALKATTRLGKDEFLKLALEYDMLADTAGETRPALKQA